MLLEEQTVGVDYLDFSKIFDTVSYRTLWEKVADVAWMGALLTQLKPGWLARTCIQLAASLQWCSPGLSPGASPAQHLCQWSG